MAQDGASFDFGAFQVKVRYLGEQDGPVYATSVEAPGLPPVSDSYVLQRLPLFSSAALAAVSELRRLLHKGVQAFVDEFRQSSGGISFKRVQETRLLLLSWHDVATAIGDEALAAAEGDLKAQELVESKATYGKEQKPQEAAAAADFQYDLGTVVLRVIVMGLVGGVPIWGVTALAPGTDLHANTIIGMKSPLPIHAAQGMIENLRNVLTLGVDRYLSEQATARRAPIDPEKRHGTEMLHAVAVHIGNEGLAAADQKLAEIIQEEVDTLEDQAVSEMEERITQYRSRKPKA